MENKITVFGGDGFIGRHLVDRLSRQEGASITVFDRFDSYAKSGKDPYPTSPNIRAVRGNFFNKDEVRDAVKSARYVFHLISTTNPAVSNNDPFIDIDTNIRKSVELFQACAEESVEKIIYISSGGAVYGDIDKGLIDEETSPRPVSPYGIGKLAIEGYLNYYNKKFGMDCIIYRVANPYGPGQNIHGKQGVVPIFMKQVLDNKPVHILGDGTMERDYVYIQDVVEMIAQSYHQPNRHPVYNIGSGRGTKIEEIVRAIEQCAGSAVDRDYKEKPPTYVDRSVLDISRFKEEFGVHPTVDLEDGIRRTWEYVEQANSQ